MTGYGSVVNAAKVKTGSSVVVLGTGGSQRTCRIVASVAPGGRFLLVGLIPVFIPIPAGQGGFSGLLIALIGAQMLWQMEHPWVPKFIGQKTFKRSHVINFQRHFDRWLGYIEKLCKPRYEYAFDHAWARAFSGLLLVPLGLLLALPISLTHTPFRPIILAFTPVLTGRARLPGAEGVKAYAAILQRDPVGDQLHSKRRSRSHLVAIHFSPSSTGAPPCSVRVTGCGRS